MIKSLRLTRVSRNQSATLYIGLKTHSGVLPQPRTLETTGVDKARVAAKRSVVRGFNLEAGIQHSRGETGPRAPRHKARKGANTKGEV